MHFSMAMWKSIVLALGILVAALGATAVQAEDLKLDTTPPTPETRVPAPGPVRGPSDPGYYPGGPVVPYDPAFIPGLSTEVGTGRAGLSGWTAPNPTAGLTGTGGSERPGWFSLGFTWTWGESPYAGPTAPPTVTR
jgi:hypothetical protein